MKIIAYYRVSTKDQGESGLGLEAQMSIVRSMYKPDLEFTEIESGGNNNRPEIKKAILEAKDGLLVIAKLDRLSRDLGFINDLMKTKVRFKCCDMPEADNFTIHIFAALAQKEREMISIRTRLALGELKKKGIKLGQARNKKDGTPKLGEKEEIKRIKVLKEKASNNENNVRAMEIIALLRENGLSFKKISDKLNSSNFRASQGGKFNQVQVQRLSKKNIESKKIGIF